MLVHACKEASPSQRRCLDARNELFPRCLIHVRSACLTRRLGHFCYACQALGQPVAQQLGFSTRSGQTAQKPAYSVNPRVPLHGPANRRNRRTQGPHTVSVTPSAEVVWLGFTERAWLGALRWLGARLTLARLGYRQRLRLGMVTPYCLAHYFAHQHGADPLIWGDAKSPG